MLRAASFAFLATCCIATNAAANTWQAVSPSQQVPVLELYTSEGCNSCPPADQWVATLKSSPNLFSQVVPVAFHVTYWDRLGWKDDYGRKQHDERQRAIASSAGAVVYTPGVFLNGQEWRNWRQSGSERFLNALQRHQAPETGVLSVTGNERQVEATFTPAADQTLNRPVLEIAYLQMNERTRVRAGENRGRTLEHEFVATNFKRQALRKQDDGSWRVSMTAKRPSHADAVAVWIVDGERYIQATGTNAL